MVNTRYNYVHDQKYPSEDVDIHHIVLKSNGGKYFFVYASALLVLACGIYLYLLEEKSISLVYYSLLFDIFLVKLLLRSPVNKESVVIMPAFGVQLETHHMRIVHFIIIVFQREGWDIGMLMLVQGSCLFVGYGFLAVREMPYSHSGKVIRRFVPIDKILKPVLLECVTPVTCYWTLSLIVHEESKMVLVFKNLRPPVKMLVYVWKALCAATDNKEETFIHVK